MNIVKANNIYNENCFECFKRIQDNSIDCIICDLQYNITKISWDCKIDLNELWTEYKRILKPSGNVVLFSSCLFTYKLIESNLKDYKYKLIWKKNVPTGMALAKYRPMKYYEEICVFSMGKNPTYNPILKERVGEKERLL